MVNKVKNYDKVYGFCLGCEKYVPRDDMISTNLTIYGKGIDEKKKRIRFRLCPECHEEQIRRWTTSYDGRSIEWALDIRFACEIMIDEGLASKCDDIDFDDQDQHAVFKVASIKRHKR